uniref:Transmembrane channel-like protein n=1 Tax=Zonotrichia albicollis TaxID=44394 RepID=A0A8D2QJ09_ZONAL
MLLYQFQVVYKIYCILIPKFCFLCGFDAEEDLVGSLASMSSNEMIKAIQKMPKTMRKKREISLKIIGAEFGTSVLSYFVFLKWLLNFNIFSFLINFGFITIPQFLAAEPNNLSFTGLELLTGAGYFQQTVLYYGFYTNATISKVENGPSYNMQLAYIFTVGIYFVICFLILLFSMARFFSSNFRLTKAFSVNASKLLCTWDFNITNEEAVKLQQKNLLTQIKVQTTGGTQLMCASHSVGDLVVHTNLCVHIQVSEEVKSVTSGHPAITPSRYMHQLLVQLLLLLLFRNIILKISIVGILCYYWLNIVATSESQCWETLVGQDIYRLVLVDFIFCLLGSFFGEFLRRIIGTTVCVSLGLPEFDIGRNVLDLIYAQTLTWIGILFSPLLPGIQMIAFLIVFFVKKVSLMRNCQPPREVWRTAQMTTSFIFLLFCPSFLGVLSLFFHTLRLKPSEECGPFRGLPSMYAAVDEWIQMLERYTVSKWVVWIYHNLIASELFFFIISTAVLILTYLYWQIIQARKTMIKLLHNQIINAGQDKKFLLQKLQREQRAKRRSSSALGGRGQQVSLTAHLLLFNCLGQVHGAPPAVQTACCFGKRLSLRFNLNSCYLTPDSKRMQCESSLIICSRLEFSLDIEKPLPSPDIIYGYETSRKHS